MVNTPDHLQPTPKIIPGEYQRSPGQDPTRGATQLPLRGSTPSQLDKDTSGAPITPTAAAFKLPTRDVPTPATEVLPDLTNKVRIENKDNPPVGEADRSVGERARTDPTPSKERLPELPITNAEQRNDGITDVVKHEVDKGPSSRGEIDPYVTMEVTPDGEQQISIANGEREWHDTYLERLKEKAGIIEKELQELKKAHPFQNLAGNNLEIEILKASLRYCRDKIHELKTNPPPGSEIPLVDLREQLTEYDIAETEKGNRQLAVQPALAEPTPDEALTAEVNMRTLGDQIESLVTNYTYAMQAFNKQVITGEVVRTDGYDIASDATRFLFSSKKDSLIVTWGNRRGLVTLSSRTSVKRASPNDLYFKVSYIGDLKIFGGEYPSLELEHTKNKTNIQLLWGRDEIDKEILQKVFSGYPGLETLISLAENLGSSTNHSSAIKLIVPRGDTTEEIASTLSLILIQEGPMTEKEHSLRKAIKKAKQKQYIAAGSGNDVYAIQAMEETITELQNEVDDLWRERFQSITYTFNGQENRFEGRRQNTQIHAEPIPHDEFITICEGLFSLIPTLTIPSVISGSRPSKILALPQTEIVEEEPLVEKLHGDTQGIERTTSLGRIETPEPYKPLDDESTQDGK